MDLGLSDTSPDVERAQVELLRRASVAERIRLVRSLSDMALQLSWRAIRRANPAASEEEVALRFVAVHYGHELAARLQGYLRARQLGEVPRVSQA